MFGLKCLRPKQFSLSTFSTNIIEFPILSSHSALTRYATNSFVITAFSIKLEWMERYNESRTTQEGPRGEGDGVEGGIGHKIGYFK
jgi:hypothetical protein